MPAIDLNNSTAVYRNGVSVDAIYRGATELWRKAPVDPAAPFVVTPPAISPTTGPVGTVFTFTNATFGGTPQPTPTHTLTQAGVDVTAQIVGGQFSSTAEGALVWTATATTTAGTATETANATVTAASSTQDVTFLNFVSAAVGTPGMNEYVISQANDITSGPAINLLTFEGVDTGWNYHPESPDGVTPTSQIGANALTIDGGTAFDGTTIYCMEAFDTTLFTTHPNNIVHVFDGLTPGGSYELQFVGSRSGTTARTSRFQVEGGAFVDAISNANPPTATAIVEATADGSGRIRVLQSSQSANFSYVSGISIAKLAPPAAIAPRTASTATTRHVGNGHSLVDTTFYGGGWPGYLMEIRNAALDPNDDPGAPVYIVKDTIPGSRLRYRWEVPTGEHPKIAFNFPQNFDTLVTVEGGPSAHDSDPAFETEFLDFLCRWTAKMIEEGGGNDVCLQTIWPSVNGVNAPSPAANGWESHATFELGLAEYGRVHEHAADYVTWKMHQLYTLPERWRVWVFPGNEWFIRVLADIAGPGVPGIDSHVDLFRDDIHPNEWGEWGLSLFMFTCLFQTDLSGNAAVEALAPADLPVGLHDYFCTIAMDVALAYPRAGLAGTVTDLGFDPATDTDPMPFWTYASPTTADPAPPTVTTPPSISPEGPLQGEAITLAFGAASGVGTVTGTYTLTEDGAVVRSGNVAGASTAYTVAAASGEIVLTVTWTNGYGTDPVVSDTITIGEAGGTLPEPLFQVTPSASSGVTWLDAMPAPVGGVFPMLGSEGGRGLATAPILYAAMAVQLNSAPSNVVWSLLTLHTGDYGYSSPFLDGRANGWISRISGASVPDSGGIGNGHGPFDTNWHVIEVYVDGTNTVVALDGVTGGVGTITEGDFTNMIRFSVGVGDFDVAAVFGMDRVPTEAERIAIRAWAEAQVPA